jgi:hypothetical protein
MWLGKGMWVISKGVVGKGMVGDWMVGQAQSEVILDWEFIAEFMLSYDIFVIFATYQWQKCLSRTLSVT